MVDSPRSGTSRRRSPGRRLAWTAAGLAVAVAAGATSPALAADSASRVTRAVGAAAAAPSASVPATADTYVVAERPTLAYGTDTRLTAANWATWHSETYLRFEVPAPPDGRPIVRSRLELTFQRLDRQPTSLEARALTGTWTESTTYATRPSVGAVVATATLPGANAAGVSFDLTAVVRAAGPYAFALTNPTAESVGSLSSRENGATGPRLVVEYGTPTRCGAAFSTELPDETYQQALAREDGYYNGLELARVFYPGLPKPWPGKLDTGGRPMVVSFKAPPAQILAGTHDAALSQWFSDAPRQQDVYWTYYHEPEDDIARGAFTAEQYRRAWQRLAAMAREARNPRLRATLILMGFSVNPTSGRNWRDYYPGRDAIDVLGWDVYNPGWDHPTHPGYRPVTEVFGHVIQTSQQEGLPFGIAETGSPLARGDDGTGRAAWLRQLSAHLTAAGALFIAYFDLDQTSHNGPDYRLRDPAGMAAWRDFCS